MRNLRVQVLNSELCLLVRLQEPTLPAHRSRPRWEMLY